MTREQEGTKGPSENDDTANAHDDDERRREASDERGASKVVY